MFSTAMQLNLPGWVSWIAQDYSGVWWAFEVEPNEGHNFWYENEVGRCVKLSEGVENPNWRNSLEKLSND